MTCEPLEKHPNMSRTWQPSKRCPGRRKPLKPDRPVRTDCVGGRIVGMSDRPFPKPPPAEPLPLEIWLDQTDRAEVGREPFFRGRDAEFTIFRRAVGSLHDGRTGGGTMIFQGAPGAGKSALMAECMEAVRRHSAPEAPWVAVDMNPGALDSPVDVIEALVEAANAEGGRLREMASGTSVARVLDDLLERGRALYRELSARGGGAFGLAVGGRRDEGVRAGRAFRKAAQLLGKYHLVVCVDEAQNTPVSVSTKGVMDCLHRDPQGIPLVAAFFGLSDTQQVLRECGLSRFARGRVVTLERLPDEDSTCAIRDILAAYGFTGTREDREVWASRLAELSQGWPQHINSVAVAACEIIRANGGRIDGALLERALASGRERKDAYYAERLAAGSGRAWVYRGLALAAEENDDELSYDRIESLTEAVRGKAGQAMDDFLTNALHAGLLAPSRDLPDHYRIPIPSFGDYLRALPVEPPHHRRADLPGDSE